MAQRKSAVAAAVWRTLDSSSSRDPKCEAPKPESSSKASATEDETVVRLKIKNLAPREIVGEEHGRGVDLKKKWQSCKRLPVVLLEPEV